MDVAPVPELVRVHVLRVGHLIRLRAEDTLVLNLSRQVGQALEIEHFNGLRPGPLCLIKDLASNVQVVLVVGHVDIALVKFVVHHELALLDLQVDMQLGTVLILDVQRCAMAIDLAAFGHDGEAVGKRLCLLH